MSKIMLVTQIDIMEQKLQETKENVVGQRSAATDALKVVIPMMEDQIKVLRAIAELLPEE